MRIISDFKDYYDNIGKTWDNDYDTLFIRKTSEETVELPYNYFPVRVGIRDYAIIGFAGKIYIQISNVHSELNDKFLFHDIQVKDDFFYNNAKVLAWVENPPKELWDIFGDIFKIYSYNNSSNSKRIYYFTKNPILRGMERIMSPAMAYMTLYNWVNNKTRPEKPIPKISNEDKIFLAGFDLKSSFRTPKKKKK